MKEYIEKKKRDYNKPNIINLGKLSERTKAPSGKNAPGSDGPGSSICKVQGGNTTDCLP